METLMVKMRKEKSETCVANKIPFPKDLSEKDMFEKFYAWSLNRGVLY